MQYISTRGTAPALSFADTLLTGLASDGGLYVPQQLPKLDVSDFDAATPYADLAFRVLSQFVGDDITPDVLQNLINQSYASFHNKEIAPLAPLGKGLYAMELFHGPTLAFKDVALQFLGQSFEHVLETRKRKVTIVGATSGDTGSAAIEACRDRSAIDIFILFPHGRVSEVQRRQMTTITSGNVHCIAINGSFDDCQDLVKAMFNDQLFRAELELSAVNSINWARIAAQVVYYFYAWLQLRDRPDFNGDLVFSVPTGNFGNVYAGYVASLMGVPIKKLIVSTNKNDILFRFFESGVMQQGTVMPSLSPSMDIQISSNFERLLFDLLDRDASAVCKIMHDFKEQRKFTLDNKAVDTARQLFTSARFDDDQTQKIIAAFQKDHDYLVDPHTAVGLGAAQSWRADHPEDTVVSLSTAHPAKFPDAVRGATGVMPELPAFLSDLHSREERYEVLDNDLATVQAFIRNHARQGKAA